MTTIVKAVKTCDACPSQWNAWDSEGNFWYLRYRWGHGTAERQESPDYRIWDVKEPEFEFDHGNEFDGYINLKEFCKLAGLRLRKGIS